MTALRPRRSVLYMPGSNTKVLEKAKTLAVDAVILDLEDAVAPDQKAAARQNVKLAVEAGGFGHREVFVRMNGLDTPWGAQDLEMASEAGPDVLLVPKVNRPEDIFEIGHRLDAIGTSPNVKIWVMMETPRAMLNASAIAGAVESPAGRRLAGFVMGTNDLAKETRARIVPGRLPMLAWLSTSIAAARAHGLEIVDGVYNDFANEIGFEQECVEGRDLGMDGKTLIHPKQADICNRVFSPSDAEVETARKIIAAFAAPENAGKGAISLDGRMVELLHADMSKRVVAIADAIAAQGA